MKHLVALQNFAETYGCNTYGSGSYNNNQCSTATAEGTSSLSDTGTNVIVGVTAGVILVIAAIVLLFWTRKKKGKK